MPSTAVVGLIASLDAARIWRVRELSDFRALTAMHGASSYNSAIARAAVVIAYSHWEGYWSDCIEAYLAFRILEGRRPFLVNKDLMLGVLDAEFSSLRDRNFSDVSKRQFLRSVFAAMKADFTAVRPSAFKPRSNMNFERLLYCAETLRLDPAPFQRHRNQIDKEIVGWRHSIAHGDNPSIDMTAVAQHLSLVESLTALTKDAFLDRAA